MQIYVISVPVQDQYKALDFYTQKLGFLKKTEIPMGEHAWLTLVSPMAQSGVELLLEPMAFEPAQVYQKSLKAAGIPWTSFKVEDLEQEYTRLCALDVKFTLPPKELDTIKMAILDDTCGNLIQLVQFL